VYWSVIYYFIRRRERGDFFVRTQAVLIVCTVSQKAESRLRLGALLVRERFLQALNARCGGIIFAFERESAVRK
jgi:hypothetical protein